MKIKNIIYILFLMVVILPLAGCGDDDDNNAPDFNKNVIVSNDYIEMDPNDVATVTITDGNGKYKVRSTDESILMVTVDGNTINVQSRNGGKAAIVITDEKNVSSLISVLVYTDLKLETNSVEMLMDAYARIQIQAGNDGYRVESDNPNLSTSIEIDDEGAFVVIGSHQEELADANVTVHDKTGRTSIIKVTVADPYGSIKKDATPRIEFLGIRKEVGESNVVHFNDAMWGMYKHLGWIEGDDGTKTLELITPLSNNLKLVGAQYDGYLSYDLTGYGLQTNYGWTNVDYIEVIKYDSATGLVWLVFLYEEVNQGVICMKI